MKRSAETETPEAEAEADASSYVVALLEAPGAGWQDTATVVGLDNARRAVTALILGYADKHGHAPCNVAIYGQDRSLVWAKEGPT